MNLFLADSVDGKQGYLGPEESHHASRVLRMKVGDFILVTEGRGEIFQAVVKDAHKKQLLFDVKSLYRKEDRKRLLHIAIAPTKSNDRFELFLEKATELGVARITPLICQNSERKYYKTGRGKKVISAAAKQSLSCWWPQLEEPVSFQDFLPQQADTDYAKYIAYCGDIERKLVLPELGHQNQVMMLIGPEGDFSRSEIEKAQQKGFTAVSLGSKRLRTETAGMAVSLAFNIHS